MPIVRLAAAFVFLTALVLLAVFVVTRNKKYLQALKQLVIYTAWFVAIVVIFSLIARVIRL